MAAPALVNDLVERFASHRDEYRSGRYNETQLRRDFLDPLFAALGWDVHNEQGYAEAYREVIHEDAIKIGGRTKAPDYCFRVGGGVRSFFVEAKKPSVDIREAISPAYQLRRYAWSAKLPVSILSDFEEFAVYDCRVRPNHNDKASTARVLYLKYTEYIERWDELQGLFSPEAIRRGDLDKFISSKKAKKGTAEVDKAFLDEIESWRDVLARNVALRNKGISQRDLNFAVQRTIDRTVFLRICEDRGIEPYGTLLGVTNGPKLYARLGELFRRADDRYNSGLFYFTPEKGRSDPPDELTLGLTIDDKPLKEIIKSLYYPDSPYEFSVLPAEILGQVYEQFLGKVIRLTRGGQAKVEEKPEVRKAGGVYYTPKYIVDYIVEHTVGKLLEGKTPHEVGALTKKTWQRSKRGRPLTVLDPACGSGSFLIGAYQHLLDWHRDQYVAADPEQHARGSPPRLYRGPAGAWRLTTAEKKRILLSNIYGVDIDPQAVEVTKLSLLLKVLEGESEQTLSNQLRLFHERALPDLSSNIKCGNSLIGPDFYDDRQMSLLDEEEIYRINVFDWKAEFPEVFKGKNPGLDAVIGNPPYVRIQAMKQWAPLEVEFYKQRYVAGSKGNYDIYVVFIEAGLKLLKNSGILGYIVPHKFFNSQYGQPLRALVSQGNHLSHLVHFGHQQVFSKATTYTCLMFLDKAGASECAVTKVTDIAQWRNVGSEHTGLIAADEISSAEWNFVVGRGAELFRKLADVPVRLGDIADVFVGLQTSADDVYVLDLIEEHADCYLLNSKSLGTSHLFEKDLMFPLASGTDVGRYAPLPRRQFILFPYRVTDERAQLIDFPELRDRFPRTAQYLERNRKRLEERECGKFRDFRWYRFGRSQNIGIQGRVKLCVPRLVERLHAAYDSEGSCYLDNVDVGGIVLRPSHRVLEIEYLLALINSRLLQWFFPLVSAPFRGGWFSANRQFLSQLPIRLVDFEHQDDKKRHKQLVKLVNQTLLLHKDMELKKTAHAKTVLQRQIDATDRQIDRLVYELYDLTDKEIGMIEEATERAAAPTR